MANEKRLIDARRYEESILLTMRCWNISPCLSPEEARKAVENLRTALNILKDEPTVDAVEVVHGEWTMVIDENDCECIECPLCGEQFYDGDNDTFDKPYNYCPNCGADMRERKYND